MDILLNNLDPLVAGAAMYSIGKNKMFSIHFWVYKVSPNSVPLHFLSNESSK